MRKTELFFDSIADDFLERMNPFDQRTRVEWFERVLRKHRPTDATVVDVGAGLGHFSSVARRQGATVIPIDIAPRLVKRLREQFPSAIVGSATRLPFRTGTIDFVVSSECIEHTLEPQEAIREMLRVLRPGGLLFLTTPNIAWRWSVTLAEWLRIRRFEGIENWLSRRSVRRTITENGGEVICAEGLYILPFQLRPLLWLIRLINERAQGLKPLMINQCWVARKR